MSPFRKRVLIAYGLLALPLFAYASAFVFHIGFPLPFGWHQLYLKNFAKGPILLLLGIMHPGLALTLGMQLYTPELPLMLLSKSLLGWIIVLIVGTLLAVHWTIIFIDIVTLPKQIRQQNPITN